MKTNTIQILTATTAAAALVAGASMKVTGDFTSYAAGVGFMAVAGLLVLAVADYGRGQRPYSA